MSERVYVITAGYRDGSGFKVLCALEDYGEAQRFVEWLGSMSLTMSDIKIHEAPTSLSRLRGDPL